MSPQPAPDPYACPSAQDRKDAILDSFAAFFGPEALTPEVYYESDWAAEEWTRGAFATSFDLGGLTRFGPDLRSPVGPIHWASSDLAGFGFQHVDGALRMGRLVAENIISDLDHEK